MQYKVGDRVELKEDPKYVGGITTVYAPYSKGDVVIYLVRWDGMLQDYQYMHEVLALSEKKKSGSEEEGQNSEGNPRCLLTK